MCDTTSCTCRAAVTTSGEFSASVDTIEKNKRTPSCTTLLTAAPPTPVTVVSVDDSGATQYRRRAMVGMEHSDLPNHELQLTNYRLRSSATTYRKFVGPLMCFIAVSTDVNTALSPRYTRSTPATEITTLPWTTTPALSTWSRMSNSEYS